MRIFFPIFFLLFASQVFLHSISAEKLLPSRKTKFKSSVLKNVKPLQTDEVKKKQSLKNCDYSAKSQRRLKSYNINNMVSFSKSQMEDLVDNHFSYMKKGWPKQCPSHCKQVNNYKIVSKTYPKSTTKGSCKKEESKESYSFKKQFPFQQSKGSMKKAHNDMTVWIIETFVYPYFPIPFLKPTKESIENNISKACPSCSFYLDYTCKYTKNNLDLDIIARCGDKRKFLSGSKMEFVLINNWSCKKKAKPDQHISNKENS